MVTAAPQDKRPKRGWWWKIPLGVLLFLIVVLTVVLLNIDAIARIQINKALNRYLVAGGKLEAVDVRLVSGSVTLDGLTINPPPEYGPHPLISMDHLEVDVALLSLFRGKVVVEQVVFKGLSLNVVRDGNGRLSPLELIPPASPALEPVEDNHETKPPWIPIVHVNSIKVEDLSFRLNDRMLEQDWSANLKVDLAVRGLRLQDILSLDILVDHLDVVLRDMVVDQPPGYSDTPLLAMGSFKLTSQGIDLGASEVIVSDVILDTLHVSLERNADRKVNLTKIADSWLPTARDESGQEVEARETVSGDGSSSAPLALPVFIVDNIQLQSISGQVLDIIEDQPWRAGFDGLDLQVMGVEVRDPAQQAISLATFDLDVRGIAVDQPPGFDTGKLFNLDQFIVISEKTDKSDNELVIKQVSLQGLTSSITMRADGVTNLQVLKEALFEGGAETSQPKASATAQQDASSLTPILPAVLFEKISLDGGPVIYRDEVFAEEPLIAFLDNIQLEATGLRLFSDQQGVDPASTSLSFELAQPGDLPTAYFGALADVGPVGYGVPMVNSQVLLVGLKLDTLGSLVPPSTRRALGATGLDVGMGMAMDAESINLNASVLTDHNIRYDGITVQGPLEKPVVKIGRIMAGVLGRVTDGLFNIGKSGLVSGVHIAEGGVGVAKELGSGVVEVGVNFVKSLFDTTVGIVTLDKEKVKEGASGTTKGTMDITKGSANRSGKAAGGSLKSSASELKGQDRIDAWDQEIPSRYQSYMQFARKTLTEMPYPPVTE